MKNVARFAVDGKTYEIERNRYLQAELNKITEENEDLSAEEEKSYALLQDRYARLEKLAKKVAELEDAYYENFEEDIRVVYERAKAQYEKMYEETVDFEVSQNGVAKKVQKVAIDNAEKVVVKALQIDNKGNKIREEQEALDIWCAYVDEVGRNSAVEWLLYFVNYLSGNDKVEDDPFVSQAKAKAEQRANMKKGVLKMAK